MKLHPSLTAERIAEAAVRAELSLDNPGFCKKCGHEQEGCEPDARGIECDVCASHAVDGAAWLLWSIT